jgi:hypothetical protein
MILALLTVATYSHNAQWSLHNARLRQTTTLALYSPF